MEREEPSSRFNLGKNMSTINTHFSTPVDQLGNPLKPSKVLPISIPDYVDPELVSSLHVKRNAEEHGLADLEPFKPNGPEDPTRSVLEEQAVKLFQEAVVVLPTVQPSGSLNACSDKKPRGLWYLAPVVILLGMGGFLLYAHFDGNQISLNTIAAVGSIAILTSAVAAGLILWKSELSKNKGRDLVGKCLGTFVLLLGLYLSYHYLNDRVASGFEGFKVMPVALSLCSATIVGSIATIYLINRSRSSIPE